MKYEIDDQIVIGLLKYLRKKPYEEVESGIRALQSLKPIEEKEKKKDVPAKDTNVKQRSK